MKKKTVEILITATIAIAALTPRTYTAAALNTDDAVNSLYEQLVTEQKNSADVRLDASVDLEAISAKLFSIDSPNTLYDGMALENRGTYSIKGLQYEDHTDYHIEIRNAYDVKEADQLTDEIAGEIIKKTGTEATDREKMYALCSYIGDNFSYDYDLKAETDRYNNEIANGNNEASLEYLPFTKVVETGYGKMTCSGFSNLTYLTANKLGIDCRLSFGKDHAYNLVKFKDSNAYIICDMTDGRYGLVDEASYRASEQMYDPASSKKAGKQYIENITQTSASKKDIYGQIFYYLLNGYGLAPDKTTAKRVFVQYLLDPAIAALAIILLIVRFSARPRHHRRKSK